jgi:hypothetical protein
MKKISIGFDIVGGPKHWSELLLCLGELQPGPLHGPNPGGQRHPGFKLITNGVWDVGPNSEGELKFLYDAIAFYGECVPVEITSLTKTKTSHKWSFRGTIMHSFPDRWRTEVVARGHFNIVKQKGKIFFSKRRRK